MPKEIERKFLVRGAAWRGQGPSRRIRQGYLSRDKERVVRVRLEDRNAWLTIKSIARGAVRDEFEYAIPPADAEYLLARLCLPPVIDKTRHEVAVGGLVWEVDEFHGSISGLVLAEVELPQADYPLAIPDWVGAEVTGQPEYYNQNLGVVAR
jgi:adenylate cyclase